MLHRVWVYRSLFKTLTFLFSRFLTFLSIMPIKALAFSMLSFEATWFDLNEATGMLCTRNKKLFSPIDITQWRPRLSEAHVFILRHTYDVTSCFLTSHRS